MRGQTFSAIYVVNIVFESIFSMLFPIGLSVFGGWLLVNRMGADSWVYVPLILFGTALGFLSMYRLISASMKALDRIEKDRSERSDKAELGR